MEGDPPTVTAICIDRNKNRINHYIINSPATAPDGEHWIACRPGSFLSHECSRAGSGVCFPNSCAMPSSPAHCIAAASLNCRRTCGHSPPFPHRQKGLSG
jgi:hypothetical protein